ncbi:MAG: EamA family transporter, partial [Candidatus Portiera sp.]|nr:EamA family transporter [Portiera sp.]
APALATLILLLQPVVAATMGWLIFNEVLTTIQIIGGLMIMIFIYLARNIK